MVGPRQRSQRHRVQHTEAALSCPARHRIGQLVRQPQFPAIGRGFNERREAQFVLRADVQRDGVLGPGEARCVSANAKHIHAGQLLAGHKCQAAFFVEPHLRRTVERRQKLTHRRRAGPTKLLNSRFHIQNRNAVFAAQRHPQFLAIAREGGLMRLPAHQDAAGQALRVGGWPCRRVGRVTNHALVDRINQVNVARAPAACGQQTAVGRWHRAMRVNAAVVQRLVNHGGMRGCHASGGVAKRWPCVLVKTGQVDRGLHRVGARVNHHQRVGIFIGDEHTVTRVNAGRSSRACRLGKASRHRDSGCSSGGELEKVSAVKGHEMALG